MTLPKISAYMINYSDYSFLKDIMVGIDSIVDELVIVDGPYTYSTPTLEKYGLLYKADNKPEVLDELMEEYPKIRYIYKTFDDEEEKRIFGYNECRNDIVLVQDGDEIIGVNHDNLLSFLATRDKFVGQFDIYNMNRADVYFDYAQKNLLFKKERIGAREHLDYLWLIGCKQNAPNTAYILTGKTLGVNYHQTMHRRKPNNLIKFIFYHTLYSMRVARGETEVTCNHVANTCEDGALCLLPRDIEEKLTREEVFELFLHGGIDKICASPSSKDKCFRKIAPCLSLDLHARNFEEYLFNGDKLGVKNMWSMYLLDTAEFRGNVTVHFKNVTKVEITISVIRFDQYGFKTLAYDCELGCSDGRSCMFIGDDISELKNGNVFQVVIGFLCKETEDGTDFYKIDSIVL
tara:strand:- start:1062 stop:2273 length:1212 start_codon:yes stop_codon:yes gene_type:complete